MSERSPQPLAPVLLDPQSQLNAHQAPRLGVPETPPGMAQHSVKRSAGGPGSGIVAPWTAEPCSAPMTVAIVLASVSTASNVIQVYLALRSRR